VRTHRPPPPQTARRAARALTASRQVHWVLADCAAAVTLLVLQAGHAAAQTPQAGFPRWLVLAGIGVAALPIAARRAWPVPVLAIVLAANTLVTVAGGSGDPAIPVALALYTVAVTRPPRDSAAAAAAALTVTLLAQAYAGLAGPPRMPRTVLEDLMTVTAVIMAAAWGTGAMQRRFAAHAAAEVARRAVTDERLRIARELHDVISHAMTLITAKAAVTSYLIDSRPEEAGPALAVIEATGRAALDEMRRLLGVLRAGEIGTTPDPDTGGGETAADGAGTARAPAPGLTGLPALAARTAAAGVRTTLDIRGERDLPEAMALSVYRIVQEALTNVVKHAAPARCHVQVDLAGDQVAVTITDDGRPRPAPAGRTASPGGHGLIGIRERVGMYRGDFTAGPRPGGGFQVAARLPVALAGRAAVDGRAAAGGRESPA
jgi:signal transduction histidine kinase